MTVAEVRKFGALSTQFPALVLLVLLLPLTGCRIAFQTVEVDDRAPFGSVWLSNGADQFETVAIPEEGMTLRQATRFVRPAPAPTTVVRSQAVADTSSELEMSGSDGELEVSGSDGDSEEDGAEGDEGAGAAEASASPVESDRDDSESMTAQQTVTVERQHQFVRLERREGVSTVRFIFPIQLVTDHAAGEILIRSGDSVSVIPQNQTVLTAFVTPKIKQRADAAGSVEILTTQASLGAPQEYYVLPKDSLDKRNRLIFEGTEYQRSEALPVSRLPMVTSSMLATMLHQARQREPQAKSMLGRIRSRFHDLTTVNITHNNVTR